jgi:hypothetical protein
MSLFPPMESLLRTAAEGGKEFSFLGVDLATVELDDWALPTMETEGMEVTARPGDGSPEYQMEGGEIGWFEPGLWDEWIVEETYRKFLFAATDVELPY